MHVALKLIKFSHFAVTHSSTPVVCLVIEGGTNTIRAVLEYVTDTPVSIVAYEFN